VLSLAMPIQNDPRTGRQVEALANDNEVTVIGFGAPPPAWRITWKEVELHTSRLRRLYEMLLLLLGWVTPWFYERYFWTRPRYRQCLAHALEAQADAYHASDWAMLPIAVRAAKAHNAKVVFDIDEYWPLFEESSRMWRWFFAPFVDYIFRHYSPAIDRAITCSPPFIERYHQEYGIASILIVNAPPYVEIPLHQLNPNHIRLIHHGAAQRDRLLENLVQAMPLLDARFSLDFLLGDANPAYTAELRSLADRIASGRVHFRPMVRFDQVVASISDCDIELCYMAPTTYTWRMTLPNKLFESMMAGLAVLTGPSPAMAQIITETGAGWVTNGFTPQDIADALNALTAEQIEMARANGLEAAKIYNAEHELAKLLTLYGSLFET